jgi:hypothetical protein
VNALAQDVAKRSGIADVTSIAIGYPVKIPLDLVQPEFLPPGNPRRLEYEAALSASNKFRNQVTAVDLEGSRSCSTRDTAASTPARVSAAFGKARTSTTSPCG